MPIFLFLNGRSQKLSGCHEVSDLLAELLSQQHLLFLCILTH